MSERRIPCRRWPGSTPTAVTPAAATSPPGTVRRNVNAPADRDRRVAVERRDQAVRLDGVAPVVELGIGELLAEGDDEGPEERPEGLRGGRPDRVAGISSMPRIVPRRWSPARTGRDATAPADRDPGTPDGGRLPPASCGSMSHATETAARAWAVDAAEVAAALATDPGRGLSAPEAAARLLRYGRNELVERGRKPPWRLLLEQFTNAMIVVLIVAAVITALLGDLKDTVVILAIVVLNGIVGFVQEYRAEQALEALKRMASPTARVVRDGETLLVPAPEVVPGDLVRLDAGDIVTADLRLVEARALRINEAALTGESEPAEKTTEPLPDVPEGVLADQRNIAFNGTAVVYGRGVGIVAHDRDGDRARPGRRAPPGARRRPDAAPEAPLDAGQGARRARLRRVRRRLRRRGRPRRVAGDDVPRRGEPGGRRDPRGAAGGRDRGPRPRRPADGPAATPWSASSRRSRRSGR